MKCYHELAHWWPLLSPPSHYVEEAADLTALLQRVLGGMPATLLELGSGGGSLASHFVPRLRATLTDLSPRMLEVSRQVNPAAEHLVGDMRTLRLGRTFDLVLVHDAVMYLTDEAALRKAMTTAFLHTRPGGAAVFMPDCVKETFVAETTHGGEDAADGRGLRYLEWSVDPDPADRWFETAYAFLLRDADGRLSVELDRHRQGLFPLDDWRRWLLAAGFTDVIIHHDPWERDVFVARRFPHGT